MKSRKFVFRAVFAAAAAVCILGLLNAQTPPDAAKTSEVASAIKSYDAFMQTKNVEGLMGLASPKFLKDLSQATGVEPRKIVEAQVNAHDWTLVESNVTGIETRGEVLAARVDRIEKWKTKGGTEASEASKRVVFLKETNGKLLIENEVGGMDASEYDPKTGIYQSRKGHYSIQAPTTWMPVKDLPLLQALMPDAMAFVGQDGKSHVILGFIQLPVKIESKAAVLADMAVEQRMTSEHQLVSQAGLTVAGLPAYQAVSDFQLNGEHLKRMRVYVGGQPLLYVFICDAPTSEQFDAQMGDFEKIIQSLKILPTQPGQTVQEAVAGELAHGSVAGQTYTSKEFNCFIAAPTGWEIQTSPNPAHLAEMHPSQGKSLVRLIAAKGLKPTDTAAAACENRLKQVRAMVKDFKEISRRNVTIQGCPGVESQQTFTVEPLGKFSVKEVTLVRDGVYYLILCQAIEPDSYAALEPQFDKIIQSFGFIQ